MAKGAIRMRKPVIYQAIDGARKPVDGGYALQTGQTVGFQVAAYDAARPLIIHPILFYSPYLGSTTRWGNEIVVDPQGQAYVTGQSRSPDFPAVNDSQPTFYDDVFIAKLNRQGTALVYSTYLGGTRNDSSSDIAVDPRGQVVVAGTTESFDFPTKNAMHPGGSIFVAQLSADGSELNYSTHLGGKWHDMIRDVAVDQLGQAVVTGSTESPDFPTFNAFQPAVRSYRHSDVFIVRFKANGAPIYSTYLGGDGYDEGYGIAVDSRGQVYVTGVTESYDFPIKNAVQPVFNGFGEFDAFVAKLSADGRTLHYSTYLGGGKDDFGMGIAVDRLGQAYVTGYTYSADFPIKNAVQPVCGDSGDYASNTFITQLSADGSTLRYSTCLERE
jgi:hypothetical protein